MIATTDTLIYETNKDGVLILNSDFQVISSFPIKDITCIAVDNEKALIGTFNSQIYICNKDYIDLIYENDKVGPIQSISIRNSFVLFVGTNLAYFIKLDKKEISYIHSKLNGHNLNMIGGDISKDGMLFLTYTSKTIRLYDKSKLTLLLWDSCITQTQTHFYIENIRFMFDKILIQSGNNDLYFYDLNLNLIDYKHFTKKIFNIDSCITHYLLRLNDKVEIYDCSLVGNNFNKIASINCEGSDIVKFINKGKDVLSFYKNKFYIYSIDEKNEDENINLYVNPFFELQGTDTKTEDEKSACIFCLENKSNVCLLPCGHIYSCISCSNRYIAKTFPCSICRVYPDSVVKVFIPT